MSVEIITPSVDVIDINKLFSDKQKTHGKPCEFLPEYVGRVCYNSYDKLTDTSFKNFNKKCANDAHRSIFEFNNAQIICHIPSELEFTKVIQFLTSRKYIEHHIVTQSSNDCSDMLIITMYGSIRAYIELLEEYIIGVDCGHDLFISVYGSIEKLAPSILTQWVTYNELSALYYIYTDINRQLYRNNPWITIATDITTNNTLKRNPHSKHLIKIVSDKGLHNEMVRHRVAVFMAESQRYVRYGIGDNAKNPFKVCIASIHFNDEYYKRLVIESSEFGFNKYKELLDARYSAQVARAVLPIATAMQYFVYTATEELYHIISLRAADSALPMAQEVAKDLHNQLINKHLI